MRPGLRIAIDDMITESNHVGARWTGTYITENGEVRSYPGVDIVRFEDGKNSGVLVVRAVSGHATFQMNRGNVKQHD
jgi:hypothetical protein